MVLTYPPTYPDVAPEITFETIEDDDEDDEEEGGNGELTEEEEETVLEQLNTIVRLVAYGPMVHYHTVFYDIYQERERADDRWKSH